MFRESFIVKRSTRPSGDHAIDTGVPPVETNLRAWLPSRSTRYKSEPLAYKILCPSGHQMASMAVISPTRRGEPPATGMIHKGISAEAAKLPTRNSD